MSRPSYSAIRAPRGKKIHALGYDGSVRTVCDKPCEGWVTALEYVADCEDCLLEIARRRRARRRG